MVVLGISSEDYYQLLQKVNDNTINSKRAKSRNILIRRTWKDKNKRFSNKMFYCLFRMDWCCFSHLCKRIDRSIGESKFKSKKLIKKLRKMKFETKESRMYCCHRLTSGDYISRKFKLAITLQLLARVSYLDRYLWSGIHPNSISQIF